MEHLKWLFSNEIQTCVFDVPWDLALGLGGPMGFGGLWHRPVYARVWNRWAGPSNRQLGTVVGSQTSMPVPSKPFWSAMWAWDSWPNMALQKGMGQANLRWKKYNWIFYHERLLYDGSYTMMTQNGLGCEDDQAIFISLWLTSMQVIFKEGISRSKWLKVRRSLPVLTHELQRGQTMVKKEILWRFIRWYQRKKAPSGSGEG